MVPIEMTKNDDPIISNDSKPTRSDAVKNHQLLLDTARELFTNEGVDNVTMSRVAKVAGVGKGTLYRHFENKTEICFALLDSEQKKLQSMTLKRLAENGDPLVDLQWFLSRVLDFTFDNIEMLSGVFVDGGNPLVGVAHTWWRQTILALVNKAHVSGDVEYIADVLYIMVNIHAVHFQATVLGYEKQRIAYGLVDTVERLVV